jgi:hypothetical protein
MGIRRNKTKSGSYYIKNKVMKLSKLVGYRKSDLLVLDSNTYSNINVIISNGESFSRNTIVPEIHWEDDFFKLVKRFKYVSTSPVPHIFSLDKILPLRILTFNNLEEIHSYLDSEWGDPVIFWVKKTCDILNLPSGYSYEIRMGIIKDPVLNREERLNELI